MKKLTAALLIALMILALVGCDNDPGSNVIDVGTPVPTEEPVGEVTGLGLTRENGAAMGMIAAGDIHSAGLRTDGSVLTAGHGYYAQRETADWSGVAYIAAGKTVTVGVKADGTMLIAGKLSDEAQLNAAKAWTNVFMADAGEDFIAAVLNDGTVVATGDNSNGQCDVSAWTDIVAIACGDAFTVGLTSAGTLVGTSGAPDVSSWSGVKAIAAGGASGVAGILDAGGVTGSVDMGAFASLDVVSIGIDDCGVAAVLADGTVVAALNEGIAPDPNYAQGTVDMATVSNAVSVAAGDKHIVVLLEDGTAVAYGVNDDLQCDVGRFNLRPYIETYDGSKYIRGLQLGTTLAEAKPFIAPITGTEELSFVKVAINEAGEQTETPCAETDLVASGITVRAGETIIGEIAMLGDVTGDGQITADDKTAVEGYSKGESPLTGAFRRAALLESNVAGNLACGEASVALMDTVLAGTPLSQFGKRDTNVYRQLYDEAKGKNADTVGYIVIPQTNISYPIMFDASGKWYYNNHTFEKEKTESGSIYAYYYANPHPQNTVVTGHNSRPSGSMFHQLHHIQEFNLGETNCAQKKYCGIELTGLPDLKIYSNRVWTVYLFGEETEWEMFSMYETDPGDEAKDIWMDNIWWRWGDNARPKEGDPAAVQEWLTKQLERTSIPFDTTVTAEDQFLTVFTCGNEHDDATKYARLFMMFKRVN